LMKL